MEDPVGAFLRNRGCGDHLVQGGLPALVEGWERTVRSVEAGYSLTLDDYLNDLDARQLIADVWPIARDDQRGGVAARLSRADKTMRRLTRPLPVCLWGGEVADEEGWTPAENWWYFARPVHAAPGLLAEIDSVLKESKQ